MKSLHAFAGAYLRWHAVGGLRMDYELGDSGGEPVAVLRFRSACGSLAFAESAEGRWSFKRVGFFKPRITVRLPGWEEDVAVFQPSMGLGGGTLTTAEGNQFQFRMENGERELHIRDTHGNPFLVVRTGSPLQSGADLEILERAVELPELPWLACFGWYLVLIVQMDSAAVTAAVLAATMA